MSIGAIMLYGGTGLFAAALIGLIISNAVLASKGKKIKKMMNDSYGE